MFTCRRGVENEVTCRLPLRAHRQPRTKDILTGVDNINDAYVTDELKFTQYIEKVMENGRRQIYLAALFVSQAA
jgi:hypothetical protein